MSSRLAAFQRAYPRHATMLEQSKVRILGRARTFSALVVDCCGASVLAGAVCNAFVDCERALTRILHFYPDAHDYL